MANCNNELSSNYLFAVNFNLAKFLFGRRKLNAELFNSAMKYHVETLDFLRNRFEQDMKLACDLAEVDEFEEVVRCWTDFLGRAQIDYSGEMSRLLRTNAGVAADTARKLQREAKEVTEELAMATAA